MGVRIRMTKRGGTNEDFFQIVAIDARAPRDGRYLEKLGWYDPKKEGVNFSLKADRVNHWIGRGASVSERVTTLLKRHKKAAQQQGV